MGVKSQGFREFLVRYYQQFKSIWKVRHQFDTPERMDDEYQFLPAHLELVEKPVSALPKWVGRCIILLLVIALIWAIVGHVEIVATATGKLTYSGRSKVIQSVETAMIKDIFVKEGQKVKAGDVLVELTTLGVEADVEKTQKALKNARLAFARNEALLEAVMTDTSPKLKLPDTMSRHDADVLHSERLISEQFETYKKERQQAEAQLKQRRAEKETLMFQIQKYQGIVKIESARLSDLERLQKQAAISKHEYFIHQTKVIDLQNELKMNQNKLLEVEESIRQAESAYDLLLLSFRRDTQDALRQAREDVEQLQYEEEKMLQRQKTTTITSPVTGTIQQLDIHTIGGVVTEAQNLMVVVPEQDKLEVTALISNQDIGFVGVGQPVTIKLDAFPYSRYGYVTGVVKSVSFDAIEDKVLGLVFSTIIGLDQDYLMLNDQKVPFSAGMRVTAEIKTGERSVISYLLSPLKETVSESMRER